MKLPRLLVPVLVLAATATMPVAADPAADLDARLQALARPATAESLASYTRNLYDALLARGFGQEQALRLVVALVGAGPGGVCDANGS